MPCGPLAQERLKFLRLMGGQKFVDAALALEGELDDEKVFELIAGEWVEAKEPEEEQDRVERSTCHGAYAVIIHIYISYYMVD